jgi:glycosyltransferase involved in cell wall biosynthesis
MRGEVGSTWVAVLDLDEGAQVAGVRDEIGPDHRQVRVLVRKHRAPVGYISVPAQPLDSLTERAWRSAETKLAEALRRHAQWDEPSARSTWIGKAACPQRFPVGEGAGITIVICTRNRPELLSDCLHTMKSFSYSPLEIIVVDNAPSGGETKEVVADLGCDDPRIRYTCEPRPGLSLARNHGLAEARYDIVAFTDDDVIPDSGWADAIAAGFAADPEAACVTGLVASSALETGPERYFDARYQWGDAFEPCRYDLGTHRHSSGLYPFRAGIFGTGANFAVRRGAIGHLGGFDPLLGAGSPGQGGEDLDLFLRIILTGGRICYLPSALVWHRHRSDLRAVKHQIHSYGHGFGAYLSKRVLSREIRASLIWHGLCQGVLILRRVQQASHASDLGPRGWRLALIEARGLVAGVIRYARARRALARARLEDVLNGQGREGAC